MPLEEFINEDDGITPDMCAILENRLAHRYFALKDIKDDRFQYSPDMLKKFLMLDVKINKLDLQGTVEIRSRDPEWLKAIPLILDSIKAEDPVKLSKFVSE